MKIVIDIPDVIYERFGYEYSEQNKISRDVNEIILNAFCNGTPLPERLHESRTIYSRSKDIVIGVFIDEYAKGWNDCLDEILGEE